PLLRKTWLTSLGKARYVSLFRRSADGGGAAGAELGVLLVRTDAGAVGPAPGALGQAARLDPDGQARHGLAGPAFDGRVRDLKLGDDAQLRKVRALDALPKRRGVLADVQRDLRVQGLADGLLRARQLQGLVHVVAQAQEVRPARLGLGAELERRVRARHVV